MKKKKEILVTKASGESVPFDETRLRKSLQKASAREDVIDHIVQQVKQKLYPGIPTNEIYKLAFGLLRSSARHTAARYKLKNAIMELGPSGFPFEKYMSELLKHHGYSVKTNQIIEGRCVTHEVDVLAISNNTIHYIECKYHNDRGHLNDVKVALYFHSRFNDLYNRQSQKKENSGFSYKGWLVTNTRFTNDAIKYGLCAGLELKGWDFPAGNSLREMIDSAALYPVTCLTTLSNREKEILLENKVVLCKDIPLNPDVLKTAGVKEGRLENVLHEVAELSAE